MSSDQLISIIVPAFNEEKNISPLVKRLIPTLKDYRYEIVFVDDGSTDGTVSEIKKLTKRNPAVKLISFYRNFGHQMALSAGYQIAQGDCIISLDADLQDPPEIISQMIEKWKKGAMVVYAKRNTREVDGPVKKWTAVVFYKFVNFLSDTPIPEDVGDFRLIDRKVADNLNHLSEQSLFWRGLVAWGGYPSEFVYFQRQKRNSGTTHYTLGKMINFAMEGITAFSIKPLRLATLLGFVSATIGFLGIIYAILGKIFLPAYWVTGWAALFVGIMFLGGVQLITIGIIGEYIANIYKEVQNRPRYLIKEKVNV